MPFLALWLGLVVMVGLLALQAAPGNSSVPGPTPEAVLTTAPSPSPRPTSSFRLVIPAPAQIQAQAQAQAPTPVSLPTAGPRSDLAALIRANAEKLKDSLGNEADFALVVHNLDTGEVAAINEKKLFKTASLYKLFVMLVVYYDISQGKMSLDENIVLTSEIAGYAIDDDGALLVPVGQSLPVRDLLYPMIVNSNNAAALMLLFRVKLAHFRQVVADMGFKGADLTDSYNFRATAEDFDQFFTRLADQKLLGPQYDPAMLELLGKQPVRDRIPSLLPPGTRTATKIGDQAGISQEAGLVFLPNGQRLAISYLVQQANITAARKFIGQLARVAYDYYVKS